MAGFDLAPDWATRHHYFHHSNPSRPDSVTFFDKAIKRPKVNEAWNILLRKIPGDRDEAVETIDKHKYENINMASGTIVQRYCDAVLLEEVTTSEAYRRAVNELHEYTPPPHFDVEREMAVVTHREDVIYAADGKKPTKKAAEPEMCELELVCRNALDGLRDAMQGLNEITGEVDCWGDIPGCELKYNGRPDYCKRIELKTRWDQYAHTDKPAAQSLPAAEKGPLYSHLMQVTGYWHLTGLLPKLVYANRLGYRIFEPTEDELQRAFQALSGACQRRERLLRVAKTPEELLRLCDPQWDHNYAWKGVHQDVIKEAREIFSG